jgi:subtilisin
VTDELVLHEAQQRGGALPAWSLPRHAEGDIVLADEWPERITREWAWGGATGKGVNVCVLDSGVENGHPLVGELQGAVSVSIDKDENAIIEKDTQGDSCGHGTACAGIIRSIAPECNLYSVRVLGDGFTGSGPVLLAGLRYAVEQNFHLINMSLSTTKRQFATILHDIADNAYFQRSMLVASAHNMPVESYPWKFSSVISVGSHEQDDPMAFFYNPNPPVEFFGRGVGVEVAWPGGSKIKASGNSFATPHIAGISALILSKHPEIIPFQLKTVLFLTATNVGGGE